MTLTVNVGIDIQAISDIEKTLTRTRQMVFSEAERRYAASRPSESETLAGIFAAKESFLKAVDVLDYREVLTFKEISVTHKPSGCPVFELPDRFLGPDQIDAPSVSLSVSHSGDFAVAVTVLTMSRVGT